MVKSRRTLFLGIFIFIIPFLGLPSFWKTFFVTLSGLTLVFFSLTLSLPKKLPKKPRKKETITPVFSETAPIYPQEIDESMPQISLAQEKK